MISTPFKVKVVSSVLALLAVCAVWELSVHLFRVPRYILPAPSAIALTISRYRDYLLLNLFDTLLTSALGLALAAAFSLTLSIVLAYSDSVRETVYPLLSGFNAIPRAALVPLLALWFGLGMVPRVLTAFLIAFFPVLVPTLTAMVTIEKELWEMLTAFGATKVQVLTKVAIPRATPYFLSSLHMGLTSAVVGSVIAEMVASDRGIGYVILSSTSRLDTPLAFSCLLLLALTTFAISKVLGLVERRVARWAYRAGL